MTEKEHKAIIKDLKEKIRIVDMPDFQKYLDLKEVIERNKDKSRRSEI